MILLSIRESSDVWTLSNRRISLSCVAHVDLKDPSDRDVWLACVHQTIRRGITNSRVHVIEIMFNKQKI